MIGLSSYFNYVKSQGRTLKSIEGILLYKNESGHLPSGIFFIPAVKGKEVGFKAFARSLFTDPATTAYLIYPSPIRWIQSDIAVIIDSLPYEIVEYGPNKYSYKMSYGRFTFDGSTLIDPDVESNTSQGIVTIRFCGIEYKINVSDETPMAWGGVKTFEQVDAGIGS